MYEAATSCKGRARAPVTNWESPGVTLAGYCYAIRHEIKVQIETPYRVSHLQRYGVTVRGNVTSVYTPYDLLHVMELTYTRNFPQSLQHMVL
jgi:hypothetical protein